MEELLGRRVPWSAEAEQAVLGSCLIDPSCLPDVMTAVRGADFYLPQNREIFETIFSMFTFAKPIDPVTVLDEMKVRGVYHDESSQQYIRELMRLTPTAANVLKYAAIVRDQALLRNVITVCEETVEAASSGAGEAGDVLDLCEKKIYALRQDRVVGGLMPVSQVVNSVYSNLSELAASGQPIPGIPTGFRDVDRRIMGMNKGDFILVAARPGMGKTSIGLNICLNAAKATGKTVAIFSLEMSREQLVTRFLSSEGEIPLGNLLTGNLTMDEWKRTAHAHACGGRGHQPEGSGRLRAPVPGIRRFHHHPVYHDDAGRTGPFENGFPGPSHPDGDPERGAHGGEKQWKTHRHRSH